MNYPWPGNVRELKSAFEYAFVNCHESLIRAHHLPPNILHGERLSPTARTPTITRDALKRSRLVEALGKSNGNLTRAARMLGISRVTVWNQMKRYNIRIERTPNAGKPAPLTGDELL